MRIQGCWTVSRCCAFILIGLLILRERPSTLLVRPEARCPSLARPSSTLRAASRCLPLVGILDRRSAAGRLAYRAEMGFCGPPRFRCQVEGLAIV